MIPTVIAKKMYGQELIVRAFQHFATSTKSHKQLRIYYQIQSIKILTRITSKVLTSNETSFQHFQHHRRWNECKKNLLYKGGTFIGRKTDDSQSFTKNVLGDAVNFACLVKQFHFKNAAHQKKT